MERGSKRKTLHDPSRAALDFLDELFVDVLAGGLDELVGEALVGEGPADHLLDPVELLADPDLDLIAAVVKQPSTADVSSSPPLDRVANL